MGFYGYGEYVPVAEKKAKALKSVEKLRKKDPSIAPVILKGNKMTTTWWGKAWNDNLQRYSDYANRIGRGRSYVRHGAVLDLRISNGKIFALVQGSSAKPYNINITIKPLQEATWKSITKSCEGKISSLQEIVEGKFPKDLSELFTAKGQGLFPTPKEITLDCSCPDWAVMCKHVAAALFGVGVRLDENPALFFELRNVDVHELISKAIIQKSETLIEKSTKKSRRVLVENDLSAVFGIDLEQEAATTEVKGKEATTEVKGKAASAEVKKKAVTAEVKQKAASAEVKEKAATAKVKGKAATTKVKQEEMKKTGRKPKEK